MVFGFQCDGFGKIERGASLFRFSVKQNFSQIDSCSALFKAVFGGQSLFYSFVTATAGKIVIAGFFSDQTFGIV